MISPAERIHEHLRGIYGPEEGPRVARELLHRLGAPHDAAPEPTGRLSRSDAFLITYGDQITSEGEPPLATLKTVLREDFDFIAGVHILPFFPWSSDDGFSVIDYRRVDPKLGSWEDVTAVARERRLMVDAVINHVSAQGPWFQAFLRGEAPYDRFFITVDPVASADDLRLVFRPRAHPLLTRFETAKGPRHVWTTFSADQVDLDYSNPRVLLEIIDILLLYVEKGAQVIRLDAVAYLWKELGTPCLHHEKTHRVVKVLRAVLDHAAPHVLLITETNVPHAENISYFGCPLGESTDEAQLVYQFPLPPLTLHTFLTGDATRLSAWAATLDPPAPEASFFNFLASHDGIGVVPALGLLTEEEIDALVRAVEAHGGLVSYRDDGRGGRKPYELNTTFFDALNDPRRPDRDTDVARFMAAHAVMLSLQGVPGIYLHSLLGSRNDRAAAEASGQARRINREKLSLRELRRRIQDDKGHQGRVLAAWRRLMDVRRREPAFSPRVGQRVLDLGPRVFALLRRPAAPDRPVLCLTNVSSSAVTLDLPDLGVPGVGGGLRDLLGHHHPEGGEKGSRLLLPPYGIAWLAPA